MKTLFAVTATICLSAAPSEITVSRQLEPKDHNASGWIVSQSYASLKEDRLARGVHTDRGVVIRYSDNNGRTWHSDELAGAIEVIDEKRRKSPQLDTFFLDPDNGRFVRFLSDYIDSTTGELLYGDAVGVGPHTRRVFYQISTDGGRSWGPKQQVIQQGEEYNSKHWAKDVWYGKSALTMDGRRILKLKDGTLVVPCYLWPSTEHRRKLYQQSGAPPDFSDEASYALTVCMLARWKKDLSGFDWERGGPLLLPSNMTNAGTCGSDEPTIVALDDGLLFAVVRTSTGSVQYFQDRKIPIFRYCAVSDDSGRTWKNIRPLTYSDGSPLYSPSSYSEFIPSSKNGKWYWIANILDSPTYGNCDPRYPLQIAELDTKTLGIKRDTVSVIQDKPPGEHVLVRYSNFRVYEERGSKDFILLMTQSYSELAKGPGLSYPTYRYRISVPE